MGLSDAALLWRESNRTESILALLDCFCAEFRRAFLLRLDVCPVRQTPEGENAFIIVRALDKHPGMVFMRTRFGGARIVDMLVGQ